jgi:hypothetical protein
MTTQHFGVPEEGPLPFFLKRERTADGKTILVVTVASLPELMRSSQYQRLAIATAALEFSRRKLIDEISDVLYGFEGKIVWAVTGSGKLTQAATRI